MEVFISALLHNRTVPLQNSSGSQHDGSPRGCKETGKGRFVTRSGLSTEPMAAVGGELQAPAGPPPAPARSRIPAIPRTYLSKREMLLHHGLPIQPEAPPASQPPLHHPACTHTHAGAVPSSQEDCRFLEITPIAPRTFTDQWFFSLVAFPNHRPHSI